MTGFLTNRWVHFLSLFLGLLVLSGGLPDFFREKIRFAVFDYYNKQKPRAYQDEVVIVDYDDESLAKVGQWPWPRNITAQMISSLSALGARAIAFDGVIAEPDRNSPHHMFEALPESLRQQMEQNLDTATDLPDYDAVLAEAIRDSGRFVTAYTHGSNPGKPRVVAKIYARKQVKEDMIKQAQRFSPHTARFLPEMEQNAAGNGSFAAKPESDGLIRRTGMIFTDGETLYPSLSLEALRVAVRDPKLVYKLGRADPRDPLHKQSDFRLELGKHVLPLDANGFFWVYYKKHDKSRDYISAYKLLEPDFFDEIRDRISGRIVLIGSSAEGLKDLRTTPISGFLPGVEIHANVIEQILSGAYLLRPVQADMMETQYIFWVGLAMIALAPFVGALWLGMICAGIIGLSWWASWQGFALYGLLVDPLYPSLAVFLIFSLSVVLTYLRAEAERKQVRQAFGLYISPDFMKDLTENPDKLKLGGEVRELTILFSDIRSFTTISESLEPEELIQLMNDFLTPMSDLVMESRGTIDKYMGDAMMAFWNAPLDDPDHARNACHAALKMNAALGPVNDAIQARAQKEGRSPALLQAGIGLNTGPCSVGNMGSRQRFAYSALGDAVNLASRLEGQTKSYGVDILAGEDTWKAAPDLAWLELDLLRVKGKSKPVRVFALLGDAKKAASDPFKRWRACHQGMIAAYRAADFDCAARDLNDAKDAADGKLIAFYALYMQRLADMVKSPPPDDWDGVFEAETK